jgi:hypothetical protein
MVKWVRQALLLAAFCTLASSAAGRLVAQQAAVQTPSTAPAAQRPPTPPPAGAKSGNPTPGTPQPDAPNLADRVTLTGCVQAVSSGQTSAARPSDPNEPSDSRFRLVRAERKDIVPPDTGSSAAAARAASATYRLKAIDSQLSPLVGAIVEISGEIVPSTVTPDAAAPGPTLIVEFVQRLAQKCS